MTAPPTTGSGPEPWSPPSGEPPATAVLPPVPPAPAPARPAPPPAARSTALEPSSRVVAGEVVDETDLPRLSVWLSGAAIFVLAGALVVFLANMSLVGPLRHYRDQRTAYDDFRYDLANGTAPVGQTDEDGAVLALGTPVAILQIPQLGLREVVLEGTTSSVLMSGPGHRRDTPLPGQPGASVIMGRQAAYGGPFGDLGTLSKGNVFTVVTGQSTNTYRVVDIRRAGDPLPPTLAAGKGRLTLITADGPAWLPSGVLRVDADLVSPVQPAPPRVIPAGGIPPSEAPMGTDSSGLVLLILWGEALLVAAAAVAWLRRRWGRWQTWAVAVPTLGVLGLLVADQAARLLPNLL